MYKTDANGKRRVCFRLSAATHDQLKRAAIDLEIKLRKRVTMEQLVEEAIKEFLQKQITSLNLP